MLSCQAPGRATGSIPVALAIARCLESASAANHARQQEDLAILAQRLVPAVAEDHAVDRHRDAARQLRLETGIGFTQPVQELAHVASVDLEFGLAAGMGLERAPYHNLHHQRLYPLTPPRPCD